MDKQLTVYILDASESMGKTHRGRDITDFEWAKQYVVDVLANRVLYNRVSDKVAVIINGVNGPEVVVPVCAPDRQAIRVLQAAEPVEGTCSSFANTVIQGIAIIEEHCKKMKYNKRILAISNTYPDTESLADPAQIQIKIVDAAIDVDFAIIDAPEDPDPVYMTPAAAVENFTVFAETLYAAKPKVIKPVSLYRGPLTLGADDREQLRLEVAVYPATKRASAPSAHWVYGSEGQKVRQARSYVAKNQPVEKDGLDVGYLYGSEIVLFSEEDREKLLISGGPERKVGLEIIAFVDEIPAYVPVGCSNYVLAADETSALGLSALARALYERAKVAFARFVRRSGSEIELVSLEPFITQETEGLLMTRLPYAQDCYSLLFNSLENDKRQPTAEMQKSMDAVVFTMEYKLDPQSLANPYNHRVANFIKQRCLELSDVPTTELPKPARCRYLNEDFASIFDIQKVDRSKTEARDKENLESTAGDLDLDELLG